MHKLFTAFMAISVSLAVAACGQKAAKPEDTIVAEETVIEDPAVDATAPAAANVIDEEGAATEFDETTEGAAADSGGATEDGSAEK